MSRDCKPQARRFCIVSLGGGSWQTTNEQKSKRKRMWIRIRPAALRSPPRTPADWGPGKRIGIDLHWTRVTGRPVAGSATCGSCACTPLAGEGGGLEVAESREPE